MSSVAVGATTHEDSSDALAPIRITVTPAQSSYFAGETFSVTVTFKNIRSTPASGPFSFPHPHHQPLQQQHVVKPKSRASSLAHKRASHSISSAPLPKPPTSPGTPRTISQHLPKRSSLSLDGLSARKGLIGRGPAGLFASNGVGGGNGGGMDLAEARMRKKLLSRSLSVAISSGSPELAALGLVDPSSAASPGASPMSAPHDVSSFPSPDSASSPLRPASAIPRTIALQLSSDHPHARKNSVLDGQAFQLQDVISPSSATSTTNTTTTSAASLSSPYPLSPSPATSASASTFSLALDPISEMTSSFSSPAMNASTTSFVSSMNVAQARIGEAYQHPLNSSSSLHLPHSSYPSSPLSPYPSSLTPRAVSNPHPHPHTFQMPHTELILYSYAQLNGTITLLPASHGSFEQEETMGRVRSTLLRKDVMGGGSMDITPSLARGLKIHHHHPSQQRRHTRYSSMSISQQQPNGLGLGLGVGVAKGRGEQLKRTHGRAASFSSSLLSLIYSPNESDAGTVSQDAHSGGGSRPRGQGISLPNASPSSSFQYSSSIAQDADGMGIRNGSGGGSEEGEIPLPTLEMQPAMLGVDLVLQPGEERSYTYSVKLPDVLPPTYKGRTIVISYELVVGTCRAQGGGKGMGANGISRVMKMPVRVYNHVAAGRSQKPYDLLWPIGHRTGKNKVEGRVSEANLNQPSDTSANASVGTKAESIRDLREYASVLLESTQRRQHKTNGKNVDDDHEDHDNDEDDEDDDQGVQTPRVVRGFEKEQENLDREKEEGMSCREAVEVMTRISKKVSYDVNKDGHKVAVLTFTKSAYRLGETIHGVVEINERLGRSRVLELAVYLESPESLPASISGPTPPRQSHRIHAEYFSNHAMNSLRTTFALDIPSDASPAFKLSTQSIAKPSLLPDSKYSSQVKAEMGGGGLEWKVRLCLHVGVASAGADRGTEGVVFKAFERDGEKGEWGSSWRAIAGLAPLERIPPRSNLQTSSSFGAGHSASQSQSWSSFLASAILGTTTLSAPELSGGKSKEDEDDWDGVKPDLEGGVGKGVVFTGEEEGWRNVKTETVECEVPVRVWPGHTAFKPMDVVFDV